MLLKQSTAALVTVRLINSVTGAPVTGVTSGSVTATVYKSDGSSASVTASGNWTELAGGFYTLALASGLTSLVGVLTTIVVVSGSSTFGREDQVFAELTDDIYTRIGAPAGASVSADIAAVETHAANADSQSSTAVTDILAVNTKLGSPAGASVSADIATATTDILAVNTKLGSPAGASVSADIATVETHASNADTQSANTYSRLGAPAGASVSADIATATTDVLAVNTKLGSPAGASVSADIAAVKADSQRIKVIQEGKKTVFLSGTYANQEVAYDTDGTTILQHSKLYDPNGNPTASDPIASMVPQVSIP